MKLSALEIKQQEFEKGFRGYDINEVQAFLSIVASEWESMVSRNKELEQEMLSLKERLAHYEKIQMGMHETLQIAKQSAEKEVSVAAAEAKNRIEKAELEAESIINSARNERREIRQSINHMLEKREDIVNNIRSYLEMANQSLEKFSIEGERLYNGVQKMQDEEKAKPKKAKSSKEEPKKDIDSTQEVDQIIDELD